MKATFYYHEWTSVEDELLINIMTAQNRKKVLERFNESAERLKRTPKSCQNRWYEIRHQVADKAV